MYAVLTVCVNSKKQMQKIKKTFKLVQIERDQTSEIVQVECKICNSDSRIRDLKSEFKNGHVKFRSFYSNSKAKLQNDPLTI